MQKIHKAGKAFCKAEIPVSFLKRVHIEISYIDPNTYTHAHKTEHATTSV